MQAIGGVNEKIEGFFDICNTRGLTGDQGVLIPDSNAQHLMLRDDVVQAVSEGKFHVYPIESIDQGIELLTDMSAGELDDEGAYPEDTINGKVQARLKKFADAEDGNGASEDSSSDDDPKKDKGSKGKKN